MNEVERKVNAYIGYAPEIDEGQTVSARRQGFYDGYLLALEDVRAEVERHRSQAEAARILATGASHDGFCINEAKENVCLMLLNYIDKQSKI